VPRGLKPGLAEGEGAQAEAWAYLRSKGRLSGARSGGVGFDGAAFGGEVGGEGVVREGAEAGDDAFGVELGAGEGGVGVGIAEEGFDGGLAEGVVAAGDDLVEVDEAGVLGGGYLLGPAAVGAGVADDVAVEPELARDERAEDGGCALGAGVGDVLAHVPAEGVDGFVGAGAGIFDVESFFADAGKAAAAGLRTWRGSGRGRGWGGTGELALVGDGRDAGQADAAVIVAELDEDDVAGLDEFEGRVPVALRDVGVAGEAADGAVDDVDFGGVEEVGDGRAPTPEAVGAEAVAVADGGVADQDEGGEFGVGGAGEAEAGFLSLGVGGCGGRGGSCLLRGESDEREEAGSDGGDKGEGGGLCWHMVPAFVA